MNTARQIAFEAKVTNVTAATIVSMICNALNNDESLKGPFYPATTIAKMAASATSADFAAQCVDVDSVPHAVKVASMERYRANTDWSGFKRWDWEAAMRTLNAVAA